MVETYYCKSGRRVKVGKKLGSGGEAAVYEVGGSTVAKIYHETHDRLKEHKLEAMIQNPPPTEDSNNNLALVWPKELLYDNSRRLIGFTMPRTEEGQQEIFNYYNRSLFSTTAADGHLECWTVLKFATSSYNQRFRS